MKFVVIGGGVAGLAAAHFLVREQGVAGDDVTLLESTARFGGCLRPVSLEGQLLDAGPDALLTRRPEGLELLDSLGLATETVAPATGRAYLASGGALHPYPPGLFLGVPTRPEALGDTRLLSDQGQARARMGFELPPTEDGGDTTVEDLVARRWGAEVAERLAGPLIAAVHAGRADYLSAAACAPQLFPDALPRPPAGPAGEAPPFVSLSGGLWRLAEGLHRALERDGVHCQSDTTVTALTRSPQGWTVRAGTLELDAERVVVALQAPAAARLLAPIAPVAAQSLASIESASVAIATVLVSSEARFPEGSGFLVPPTADRARLLTAGTWFDQKWGHLARGDGRIVRLSTGRHRDSSFEDLDDDELADRLTAEAGEVTGQALEIRAAAVTRFPAAFPQYAVGHVERIAEVLQEVEQAGSGTLAVCGNAYSGVGLPAVIATARSAVRRLAPAA